MKDHEHMLERVAAAAGRADWAEASKLAHEASRYFLHMALAPATIATASRPTHLPARVHK